MKYFSLNKKSPTASFKEAVVRGLAPDRGLYFPEHISPLPKEFFDNIHNLSNSQIAYRATEQLVSSEIPTAVLKTII